MSDSVNQPWALQPMKIKVTDKGQVLEVSDAQPWVSERKQLLKKAREMIAEYNGEPRSLYKHHNNLVEITKRLAQIKVIFDLFNQERARHADANIAALVKYFNDPATMEGVDD